MVERLINVMFGSSRLGGKNTTKGLLNSKTFYGIIMILVGYGLTYLELDLDEPEIKEAIENILAGLGAALALYGRVKAVKEIG